MRTILMLICALCGALLTQPSPAFAGSSVCCPADLDGDAVVGASDLGVLLGAWGRAAPGSFADIDQSGDVGSVDLGILLGAWGSCPLDCPLTMLVGLVQFESGAPVDGAVIVTDQGGQGVSTVDGGFAFEVTVPNGVTTLHVTAVTQVRGVTYTGAIEASPIVLGGVTSAGAITVSANRIAKWNGSSWSPLGGGTNGAVVALTVFDDGSGGGSALYVGGISR